MSFADRMRRLERPETANVPLELWVVVGLLTLGGLILLFQTLPAVPRILDVLTSDGAFRSLGLFISVLVVEVALLGVVLLVLAYSIYCGDPSARMIAIVLCGAMAVKLVLEQGQTSTDRVLVVVCLAIVGILVLAPATREWFAAAAAEVPEPSTIVAARSVASVMAVVLGMIGLALLPLASEEGIYAVVGIALGLGAFATLRTLGAVREGDFDARNLLSGLMVAYVVVLLLARRESTADDLIIPVVLAGAVIALLWLPAASQAHFGAENEPVAGDTAAARETFLSAVAPDMTPARAPVRPHVFHEAFGIAYGSKTARSSALQLTYDQETWFPLPDDGEEVQSRFVVSMAMLDPDGSAEQRLFHGTSTMLVTNRRLAGVCPSGTSALGPLDSKSGPVLAWSVPLEVLTEARVTTSTSGSYVALGQRGGADRWLLLARPRVPAEGQLRPAEIDELAAAVRLPRPDRSSRATPQARMAPTPRAVRPARPAPAASKVDRSAGSMPAAGKGQIALTATQRARTALRGTTALSAPEVLALIKTATSGVKGGGASLLTTGLRNIGAQVNLDAETPSTLRLSMTSGKRLVDLNTFTAEVSRNGSGRTVLRVGGLDRYRTVQKKLYYLIPVGPKQILGMAPYKRLLELTAELISEVDPSASMSISSNL